MQEKVPRHRIASGTFSISLSNSDICSWRGTAQQCLEFKYIEVVATRFDHGSYLLRMYGYDGEDIHIILVILNLNISAITAMAMEVND